MTPYVVVGTPFRSVSQYNPQLQGPIPNRNYDGNLVGHPVPSQVVYILTLGIGDCPTMSEVWLAVSHRIYPVRNGVSTRL